jgi:hypothetical protein
MNQGCWSRVLGNHDRPRVASRVGRELVRIAAMLLLTLRGTPTINYGDEVGMVQASIPPEQVRDPLEKNIPGLGLGRDGARTQCSGFRVPMPASLQPIRGCRRLTISVAKTSTMRDATRPRYTQPLLAADCSAPDPAGAHAWLLPSDRRARRLAALPARTRERPNSGRAQSGVRPGLGQLSAAGARTQDEPLSNRWWCGAVPTVRIRLPPGASQQRTRAAIQRSARRQCRKTVAESFVEAEVLERGDRDWRSPEAGNGTWPCECARTFGIEIFAPNAENGPVRASIHSLKDR